MNNRTVYWMYSIVALILAALWLGSIIGSDTFHFINSATLWTMVWIGLGALVVFIATGLLSLINIRNYKRWVRIVRMYLLINFLAVISAVLLFGVLSNLSNWIGNVPILFGIFLLITGVATILYYYEFSDDDLISAGRNSNNSFNPPHRNLFIGLIFPVLMGISFLLTPSVWEWKSNQNIAWAQSLEIVQFKGEVLITIEDEDDAERLLDFLCFDNNPNWKIGNYSLLTHKHFTKHGEEEVINFTFDGTERNQALYFRSGDKSTELEIEQRE